MAGSFTSLFLSLALGFLLSGCGTDAFVVVNLENIPQGTMALRLTALVGDSEHSRGLQAVEIYQDATSPLSFYLPAGAQTLAITVDALQGQCVLASGSATAPFVGEAVKLDLSITLAGKGGMPSC